MLSSLTSARGLEKSTLLHPPKEWRCGRSTITFCNIFWFLQSMFSASTASTAMPREVGKKGIFGDAQFPHLRCINTVETFTRRKENEQMSSTIYKRRSINLDDKTYKRGKLLAKSQTVSLSALLRLLINGAYEQYPDLLQQQDGSRSC